MINDAVIKNKSYEEWMAEALREIPLYCEEWTNFNPSDPGITLLENLTALQSIQQNFINQIPRSMQEAMLKMVGFEARPGKCAKVLLAPMQIREGFSLPANQRFYVGDVSFEINREQEIRKNRLLRAFSEIDGKVVDCSNVLDYEIPLPAYLFGKQPKEGNAFYLFMEEEPDRTRDLILYARMKKSRRRNVSEDLKENPFVRLEWQCYTEQGFVPVPARDFTYGFTHSGEIRIRLKNCKPARYRYEGREGFCLRCVVQEAEYDIAPRLIHMYGFLFEAWQKESQSLCYTFPKKEEIPVHCNLFEEEYLLVFCKEEGENFYRSYVQDPEDGTKGRYYTRTKTGMGRFTFRFDQKAFGFGPGQYPDAIKIVAYSEAMMRQFDLGAVYGYDDQEILLPVRPIVKENFSVIARRQNEHGEEIYEFVKPGKTEDDELQYSLDEAEGKIMIHDAGRFIDARLYLGAVSTTLGEDGNVLEGNEFLPMGDSFPAVFLNPAAGTGGRYTESFEEVRTRFLEDFEKPYVAVKESDYEKLVCEIPNLCIDKVRAIADHRHNSVTLVVKPDTDEAFPKLSETYRKQIQDYLNERRLLNTCIHIHQPAYAAVNVQGTIYVKKHYEGCRAEIEGLLREKLDYIRGPQQFGDCLKYDEIYYALEHLPGVSYIHDLSLYPQKGSLAAMKDNDLQPEAYALCYPGEFYLEIVTDVEA